jgi:aspartyl-tRNA(Asn)/glutamyl-tRNA(Gln) amidotransferase subunit B
VTEPEFDNAEDVKIFLEELQAIVRHLKISDADMHKGGMRLEPNISVRKLEKNETSQLPKYKVEIKNINSFAFVHRAIKYEIDRQIEILSKGLTPSQETRGFDSKKMITFFQRSKEAVKDYKYFPEPDIPPIYFSKDEIIKLTKNIPQLPDQIINRWVKKYGINTQYAKLLTRRVDILVLLENVLKTAKTEGTDINKLVSLIVNKKIFVENRFSVQKILDSFRELTVTYFVDEKEIQAVIKKVITENKKAVSNYQGGKIQALEFLLGKCLGLLKKGVNPTIVRNLLLKEL